MKAILTDEDTLVYGSTEDQSISVATVHKNDEMELGKVIRKKGKVFVEITLPGNEKGYIAGETKIFAVRKGQVSTKTADLVDSPNASAVLIKTLQRGTILTINGVEKTEEGSWFKALDDNGVNGYISTSAKLKVVPEYTRSGSIKNMLTGLVFIVIGIGLGLANSRSASASISIYIAYAIIFFGLLQGGQGVVEYFKFKKSEDPSKKQA
jgi:hypothetical protein